jgi:hypothetical protein
MRSVVIMVWLLSAIALCFAEEGLVGYWDFEERGGKEVKDLSGSGNDGAVKGKIKWDQGKSGLALALSKDGKGYIEIKDSESLDISDQITMTAWIKPTEIYVGNDWKERNCIAAKRRAYYMDISERGHLASYLYGPQPQQWLEGTTDLTAFLNTWIYVATVYDGKEHRLYVNGNLDASLKKSGSITVNNDNLTIGWVDNNRYFDGLIDQVRIWSRALSEDELRQSMMLSVNPKDKLTTCWGKIKHGDG